jgi:DNA-binding CsgD family transcriptional regulator
MSTPAGHCTSSTIASISWRAAPSWRTPSCVTASRFGSWPRVESHWGSPARSVGASVAVDEGRYQQAAALYATALRYDERVSHRAGVSWVTQRLGFLAIRAGEERCGVRVLAATREPGAAMLRGNVPELAYERRRALDHARAVLGDEAFSADWTSGQVLTLEQASVAAVQAMTTLQAARTSNGRLTQRQLAIANCIVRGLTNRQIAEQLVVSPHTVERHLENILRKLRLASRTEIAVWMVEHRHG